jgi:hypothetical protein
MGEFTPPVIPARRLSDQAQPRLTVSKLVLRPWALRDVGRLVEAYSDPSIQRRHVRSMSGVEAFEWVTERSQRWATETGVDWAVVDRDLVVGRVGFNALHLTDRLVESTLKGGFVGAGARIPHVQHADLTRQQQHRTGHPGAQSRDVVYRHENAR